MAAPTLPADVKKLRDQLGISQAPSAKKRSDYTSITTLGGLLGNPYSARRLSLETCYEMRTDAIIQFAELVALSVRLQSTWYIECRNAQLANFIDKALRLIIGRATLQFNMRRTFGYQALVKEFAELKPGWTYMNKDAEGGPKSELVWDYGNIPALVWEPPVPLRPESVAPAWTADGKFDGIKLSGLGWALPGIIQIVDEPNGTKREQVDLKHSLWVVNERDWQFGSIWGYPRIGYTYKFWRAYEMVLGILNRAVESKGDPTVVVSFPTGNSEINGEDKDNQEIAFEIAEMARSGSVLVIPSEVWSTEEAAGGKPKWKVEYLKVEEHFDKLSELLSYLDIMKVRSMGIGEQAVMEGSGGTSSRNVAQVVGERSAEIQSMPQSEDDDIFNRYMIPQLVQANFPELAGEPCRKVTKTFGEGQAELAKTLLESYANANSDKLPINWEEILKDSNIATLEGDALASFYNAQKQLAAQAEATPPPTQEPSSNGNAGVEQTGFGDYFYYDARPHIDLAEDETLLAQLPPTKHYQDKAVMAHTRLLRKMWFDLFSAQYEDFAKYLERDDTPLEDVELAEGDDDETRVKKIVDAIVKGWRYTAKGYKDTVKKTGEALSAIFSRAGELELRRTNLKLDDWKPEEKELADWVRNNAAAMVRKVDETTRKQLRTYLTEQIKANKNSTQIAAGIRQHFAEFPAWRSDLIAREEVRRFYNAATLFAARDVAGTRQVQALDARYGPTDDDCEKRNGRLYPIEDAFREDAKEHPRGTLAWRIVNTKAELAIERLSAEQMGDMAARVDRESGKIYLVEGLDPAAEGQYLLQVGDWIEAIPD